jgi:hypothetical protein
MSRFTITVDVSSTMLCPRVDEEEAAAATSFDCNMLIASSMTP